MHVRLVFLSVFLFIFSWLKAQTTDLLISEYVEGSSNNKYLEIYNGTGANVNLADYAVRIYFNGNTAVGSTINLSGTLANGNVYVIANSSATVWGGTPDLVTGSLNFNGDDAVELFNTSTNSMVDLVGNIGCDPGSQWSSGGNNTSDNTLVRNANVCSGVTSDPTTSCPFPTLATEWMQLSQNDVSNLGSHTNTCGTPCVIDTEPTTNSSFLNFPDSTCTSIDVAWTNGNGANRIVVVATSPIVGVPSDQNSYSANSIFGLGSTISAGEYVVFNGSSTGVTVTGLTPLTTYYFAVFEYNGNTPNCEENYLTTGYVTGSFSTSNCPVLICPEITGILVDACGGTIEGINEFFTFNNGSNSLQLDSLKATFPSGGSFCNSGCGTQTWTTNPTFVAQLNTTANCPGLFVEANPIPANAKVIVFTGASPSYNFDFTNLCGTGPYYAVFANNTNTGGRFANYNATCANRTLNVEFGALCSDDATYDRCLLSNNDGDYVTFDAAGNPTYQSDGCTPQAILPVELLEFTGEAQADNINLLQWTTATEINNDYFTLERSEDAINFETVATIGGAGNSSVISHYHFFDAIGKNAPPTYYYRLKQTDFDGKFEYFNIVAISRQVSDELSAFYSQKQLHLLTNKVVDVQLFDMAGKEVFAKKNQLNSSIDLSFLSTGLYVYRITSQGTVLTEKFLVE